MSADDVLNYLNIVPYLVSPGLKGIVEKEINSRGTHYSRTHRFGLHNQDDCRIDDSWECIGRYGTGIRCVGKMVVPWVLER